MSNLESLRKRGNFLAKEPFSEEKDKLKENVEKKLPSQTIETEKYTPSKNQRKTLKVSSQTKKELEELKRYLQVEYNYEVIQFLIDDYVTSQLSPSEKVRFKGNTQ